VRKGQILAHSKYPWKKSRKPFLDPENILLRSKNSIARLLSRRKNTVINIFIQSENSRIKGQ
jgi:hypothetical protein